MFVMMDMGLIIGIICYLGLAILFLVFPWFFSIFKFFKSDTYKSKYKWQIGVFFTSVILLTISIVALIDPSFGSKAKNPTPFPSGLAWAMIVNYSFSLFCSIVFFVLTIVMKHKNIDKEAKKRAEYLRNLKSTYGEFSERKEWGGRARHHHLEQKYRVDGQHVTQSKYQSLKQIKFLLDTGSITQQQYTKIKEKILNQEEDN